MKKVLFLSLFLLSFGAFAQNEVAQQVCLGLTFDSDKMECMEVIRSGYIADNAALVCKDMSFDSNKADCLKVTVGKAYLDGETSICKSLTFDSRIIECMKDSGVPYESRVPRTVDAEIKLSRIERLARAAKRDLLSGRVAEALAKVVKIIDIAEDERY